MTPVNLGDLPSNEAAPTGRVQFKRGAANAQVLCPIDHTAMGDGAGSPMRLEIWGQTRPGWWVFRAENIFIIGDNAWYWFAWYIKLEPADENGVSQEFAHHRLHSALGWQQSCIDTAFKLKANQYYIATMTFRDRQAGSVYYWTGPDYCTLSAEYIAEGSL